MHLTNIPVRHTIHEVVQFHNILQFTQLAILSLIPSYTFSLLSGLYVASVWAVEVTLKIEAFDIREDIFTVPKLNWHPKFLYCY